VVIAIRNKNVASKHVTELVVNGVSMLRNKAYGSYFN
jgi:hypothetical protein